MKGKTMKSERISVCKLILFIMAVVMMFSYRVFAFEGGDEDTGGEIVITSTGAVIADTTDGQLVNSYNAADNTWSGNHGNAIWDDDNKTVSFCIRAEILFGSTYACESKHGTPWHYYRGHTALMIKNPEYNPTQEISENNKEYVYVPNTEQETYLIRQKGTPTNADYTNTGMQTINFSHIDLKNYIIKNDRSFYVLNKGFTGNTQNMSDNNIGTAYASCEVNFGHIELGVFSFLDGLFGYTRSSVANTLNKWSAATGYDDVSDVAFHHIYIDDPICTYHYDFDTDPGDKKITSGIIYDKQKDEDASPSTFSEIVSKDKIGQYCHITFYTESGMYQNVTIEITQGVNVDFNLNGAEGTAPGPFYVTLNDTDILFPDINEDVFYNYYNFCGWSEKPLRIYEADEEIPKDIYTVYQNLPQLTEDITYYAVWQKGKVSVNIKFYLNGVLLNDYPDYITIDGNITDTSGHTQKADKNSLIRFDKGSVINLIIKGDEDIFYISSDNPEKQTDYRININEQILKDTTYTLKFGTIHTVKYDMNGGRLHEPTLDEKKYFGTNLTILKNIPERTGYEFSYYEGQGNYEKDENKLYNPKDKYTHNQKGGTDIIKAVWEPVTYNITFNPNKPVEASTEIKGKMPDNITLTYDAPYTLPDNRYKLAGWVFMEWNTKPDGSGNGFKNKAEVVNLTSVKGETVVLYAQWKNINGETFDPGSDEPNWHDLKLVLNNNASIYSLPEETVIIQGSSLEADSIITVPAVKDINFKISKFAEKSKTEFLDDENKYSFYKLKAGDTYMEDLADGNKIIKKFVGWSVYKYATLSQSPQIIHAENIQDNMLNIIYECQAVNKLGYNNENKPVNEALSGKADTILENKEIMLENADDLNNRSIVLYAVWDEYPLMQIEDIGIMSENFKNVTDEGLLEETIIKSIYDALVTDREDGNWNKGVNRDITVSIDAVSLTNAYNFLQKRYESIVKDANIYSSTGATSVNITVTDKTGNVTVQIINVWIIANNPMLKNENDITSDDSVFKPVTSYVRAITREFYEKEPEDGGLLQFSLWKVEPSYKKELTDTFDILEKDSGYEQVWNFTHKEIKDVQKYIQENGLGNSENKNALKNFYNIFSNSDKYKCRKS